MKVNIVQLVWFRYGYLGMVLVWLLIHFKKIVLKIENGISTRLFFFTIVIKKITYIIYIKRKYILS